MKSLHVFALIAFSLVAGCRFSAKDSPPNIIFILADDLGYSQLGCYGSNFYKTPSIDKLSLEGMRFTNAYAACAVCSPTRASIMTGKYPARLHLTDFIAGNSRDNYALSQPDWQKYLPLEETTIAEMLKAEGYKTALFGKWHLSQEKTPPGSLAYNPDKQGFHESFVTYKPSQSMARPWQDAEKDGHNVDTITSLAIDFLERNKSNPFFLFVSHNTIHDPLREKAKTIQKYEDLKESKEPENHPIIAAMIERLDNSCGLILNKISELGLENNTVVVFFSDNGGKHDYAAQTPFRAGKGWLYEGGIREPLIVKWPGNIKSGQVSDELVISTDFYPTFLQLAGIEGIFCEDGKSLVPVLTGQNSLDRESIFWHYPHYHGGSGMCPAAAIRHGDFKLIEWFEPTLLGEGGQVELYNLRTDMGETRNIADENPKKTMELRKLLHKWQRDVDAQMPVINSIEK